jgi:hypothetical protein
MPNLTYTYRFRDGEALSGAKLDSNFAAVTTLVNTTKLDETNFRKRAAFLNEQKQYRHNLVPAPRWIPQIQTVASASKQVTVWAFPFYIPGGLAQIGAYFDRNNTLKSKDTFAIDKVDGCYHSATNLQAGDTLTVEVSGLRRGMEDVEALFNGSIKSDNTILTVTPGSSIQDLVYAHITMTLTPDGTVATRNVYNVMVTPWIRFPHVR